MASTCSSSQTAVCGRLQARRSRLPLSAQRALGCSPPAALALRLRSQEQRSRDAALVVRATQSVADYVTVLEKCEADGDWLTMVELLTEIRMLKLDLPVATYECCVRTLCAGDQWKRAVDLVKGRDDVQLSDEVVLALFLVLSQARQEEAAQAALDLLQTISPDQSVYGAALNVTIRACARGGMLDRAHGMLEKLAGDPDTEAEWHTYSVVAKELIIAGRPSEGLDVLEWRDYL